MVRPAVLQGPPPAAERQPGVGPGPAPTTAGDCRSFEKLTEGRRHCRRTATGPRHTQDWRSSSAICGSGTGRPQGARWARRPRRTVRPVSSLAMLDSAVYAATETAYENPSGLWLPERCPVGQSTSQDRQSFEDFRWRRCVYGAPVPILRRPLLKTAGPLRISLGREAPVLDRRVATT